MKSVKNFIFNNYRGIVLFFISIVFCYFTGNRGIFPIDSFSHYDSGYRILNGEHPFRDYWVVSGPFIDYIQSIIFFIFGTSWQSYILNSAILNGIISVSTYYLFINLGLKKNYSFFYSVCFAILAYPSSGTVFVDHHSVFLSMLAVYSLILAIKNNKNIYWVLIPIFLIFAFLSKQVPATYILFSILIILLIHLAHQSKKNFIKIIISLFLSSTSIMLFIFLFLQINHIPLENFTKQYLYYPSTIGKERYGLINYDFKNTILNFKFIHISILILFLSIFKNTKLNKFFFKSFDFKLILICAFLFISLAQHLIVTKNQIFIFFLIPLYLGFAHNYLKIFKFNKKKYILIFLILFCAGTTIKYHQRFNLERKFHELNKVNFSNSISAEKISKKFKGLNWITPRIYRNYNMNYEIKLLNVFNKILIEEKTNKIVITNYSFFSTITDQNVSGFSRWYPGDNSAFPIYGNEFYDDYKEFIIKLLLKKKINTIYILPDVSEKNLTNYISQKCFYKSELRMGILKYDIKNECVEFSIKS